MRRFITSICAALISAACLTGLKAQESATPQEVTVLQVNMKNGAVNKFRLPDSPAVTFDGDNLTITSAGMESSYARADVSHFDFGTDRLSAIDNAEMQPADFTFTFTDNANVTLASPRLTGAELYDASGRRVASVAATPEGHAIVKVGHLAPGIYIVAPDCHPAIKIIKR